MVVPHLVYFFQIVLTTTPFTLYLSIIYFFHIIKVLYPCPFRTSTQWLLHPLYLPLNPFPLLSRDLLPTPPVLTCSHLLTCFPPNHSTPTLLPSPLTPHPPPTHQFLTYSVLRLPLLNHPIPSTHLFSTNQLNCAAPTHSIFSSVPHPSSHLFFDPSVLTCSPAQDGGSLLPYDGGLRVPLHITGEVNIIS